MRIANIVLDSVDDKKEDLRVLAEKEDEGQISNTLVGVAGRGNKLQRLHLTEMSRIAHKEDEEKLGHVDGLGLLLVLTESGTNVSSFLGNDSTFFSSGFGGTNTSDELTKALVGQCRETNIHRGWFLGRRGKEIDKKTEKK